MTRYVRFLPLVAIALLGWWAFVRLERESVERFAAAKALLVDEQVLKAGAVELAGCGPRGCADRTDNIYRLGSSKSCFLVSEGAPAGGTLGTGILVAERGGGARLVLLDLEGGSVTALGERAVAPAACPPAPRR
jgi:hypothetical protein